MRYVRSSATTPSIESAREKYVRDVGSVDFAQGRRHDVVDNSVDNVLGHCGETCGTFRGQHTLWTRASRVDSADVSSGGGRGVVRGAYRPSGDRLHHVLLRTSRRRLAFPVRRDVLRRGEPSVSRAWLRGAPRGGTGLHVRGTWEDESHGERGDAAPSRSPVFRDGDVAN